MRQAVGKNNLKLSTKGFFSSLQHKKHMAGVYFHLAFFVLVASFTSDWCRAGEADSHLHLPGRAQLQVKSSHHDSAANIFPLIISISNTLSVFYSPGQKGRKTFKHLEEMPPPKENYPENLQFRINKVSRLFCRGFLSPICRGEFFIYHAAEREGLSTR